MPAYTVSRSILVDASASAVFDHIADFGTWTRWSPWLPIDPAAEVTVSDPPAAVGSRYAWKGEIVGQGSMEHQTLDAERGHIESKLVFVKPFRSESRVLFEIHRDGDQAHVTWVMEGKLPWFLFWMKSNLETFVGMDYERGLAMLKEFIETGRVTSKMEVHGIESVQAACVAGVRDRCPMEQLASAMGTAMEKIEAEIGQQDSTAAAYRELPRASVYHESSNLKTRQFEWTTGVLTTDAGAEPPTGWTATALPAGKFLRLTHTGSYDHLGNAWSGAYQYAQAKKIKIRSAASFEIYRNDPSQTPAESLVTDVYLPVRG